jgi:hypothetical protein
MRELVQFHSQAMENKRKEVNTKVKGCQVVAFYNKVGGLITFTVHSSNITAIDINGVAKL